MKKLISVELASIISQLVGSDNAYDEEEKKNPAQASSTNAYKKVRLNNILKKSKQVWRSPSEYVGSVSSLSLSKIEYKTLVLGSTRKWDRGPPKNHLRTVISNLMSFVMNEHDEGDSITEIDLHAYIVVVGKHVIILADTGNKVYVSPCTPDYQALEKLLIVDVAVK